MIFFFNVFLHYLDTGRSAFSNSIRHGGTGRIDHAHQTNKSKVFQWEVRVISIELVADRVLVGRQLQIAETEYTLAKTTEFQIRIVESLFHFFVQYLQYILLISATQYKNLNITIYITKMLNFQLIANVSSPFPFRQ